MKHTDWQSLHINAYKSFMRQKYNEDVDIPYHNVHLLNKIEDEEQFDNELINLNNK